MTRLHAEETYKCKLSSGREMAVIRQSVNNPEETRLKVTADRQLCHPVTSEPRRRKMKLILTCHAHMKFKPHVSIWLEWNNVKSRDSLIGPSSNGTYFPRSSSNNNNIHFKQKLESVLRSSSPMITIFSVTWQLHRRSCMGVSMNLTICLTRNENRYDPTLSLSLKDCGSDIDSEKQVWTFAIEKL